MNESWAADAGTAGTPVPVSAEAVPEMLRARVGRGQWEIWLTSSSGRSLVIVTNAERAMVMLLDTEGDPGEHAVDPGAEGSSGGFVLANGQHDEYRNEDTVPVDEAFRIVRHIVGTGTWPPDARRIADR